MRLKLFLPALMLVLSSCETTPETVLLETDVLIAGGGASGVMASIQAARSGADVILVEETDWLGGMLTSAGVSAIDGNHMMPSGLWGEFRSHLYEHYGGPEAVETGWVSNTLFEPHTGNSILHRMVEAEPRITVIKGYYPEEAVMSRGTDSDSAGDVETQGTGKGTAGAGTATDTGAGADTDTPESSATRVDGIIFRNDNGDRIQVKAKVTIEATEYGDLLPLTGAGYRFGFEPRDRYGEPIAPEDGHDMIQDLTYVAILHDFGDDADKTVPRQDSYDPSLFDGTCRQLSADIDADVVDCGPDSGKDLYMLNYGRLPNDYYMINWPIHGNDIYIPILEMSREERISELERAKEFTLNWIYFIQTEGGYRQFGLADDIFPTSDHFPMIPYIRESRRVNGIQTFTSTHIKDPFRTSKELYKYGIAVGDYPLDLHHERKPVEYWTRTDDLPRIPSYNVPWGTMVPESVDGLIVAEKSISVTHVANGTTRLQPVVMLLGQAAGTAAALAAKTGTEARDLSVRDIQTSLLSSGTWLMPYVDVIPEDPAFIAVQRIGLTGVMKGEGVPEAWANRTYFHPNEGISRTDLEAIIQMATGELPTSETVTFKSDGTLLTRAEAVRLIWESLDLDSAGTDLIPESDDWHSIDSPDEAYKFLLSEGYFSGSSTAGDIQPNGIITRKEIAVLVDRLFNPFENLDLEP